MDRAARIEAVRAAMLEGARKHFPKLERVEITDDALIALFEHGILDGPEPEFESFLATLRDPSPPRPVAD